MSSRSNRTNAIDDELAIGEIPSCCNHGACCDNFSMLLAILNMLETFGIVRYLFESAASLLCNSKSNSTTVVEIFMLRMKSNLVYLHWLHSQWHQLVLRE